MKAWTVAIALLMITFSIYGEDASDPQGHVINRRFETGDVIKKMTFDINGDGVPDLFFTTIEANPDPTTKISNDQAGGSMSWDAYVSNPHTNTFKICDTLEEQGSPGLLQGVAPLDVNPDQMYVGKILEISRFGIVTSAVKRSKSENSTIIYAYTWEGDHFKQWKLVEYVVGQQNAIFDKYLKDDKRTHVTLQQIKP